MAPAGVVVDILQFSAPGTPDLAIPGNVLRWYPVVGGRRVSVTVADLVNGSLYFDCPALTILVRIRTGGTAGEWRCIEVLARRASVVLLDHAVGDGAAESRSCSDAK